MARREGSRRRHHQNGGARMNCNDECFTRGCGPPNLISAGAMLSWHGVATLELPTRCPSPCPHAEGIRIRYRQTTPRVRAWSFCAATERRQPKDPASDRTMV